MKIKKQIGRRICAECFAENPDCDFVEPVWKITVGETPYERTFMLCAIHLRQFDGMIKMAREGR